MLKLILHLYNIFSSLFKANQEATLEDEVISVNDDSAEDISLFDEEPKVIVTRIEQTNDYITDQDIITSSGKYLDRAESVELTKEVKNNINQLVKKINSLFRDLEHKEKLTVSSGFRPSDINSAVGGATKSLHMRGLAVDLVDIDGNIDYTIQSRPDLLKKYDLWLEHPDFTKGWSHIDLGNRIDRPIRIFKP